MRTLAIAEENGRPPSRANDQSCRDDVAISLMIADVKTMIMMAVITLVAA